MAMTRVCDKCGKLVVPPFKQIKILDAPNDKLQPKEYKTIRSMDMHEHCYVEFMDGLVLQILEPTKE